MGPIRRIVPVISIGCLAVTACGGSDTADQAAVSVASSVTDGTVVATDPPASASSTADSSTTAAPAPVVSTLPSTSVVADTTPVATAVFDGPAFVDVIDDGLAVYRNSVGLAADPATIGAVAPLAADLPLPASGTITGAGRTVDASFGAIEEEQLVGLPPISGADLDAFGAAVPAGWTTKSFSTSGSISTLLITSDADGRRGVFVVQEDPADTTSAPFEVRVTPTDGVLTEPVWVAALPHLQGGELVEVVEGVGSVSVGFSLAGDGFVSARWRYPETALADLEAYLESGVVESAGFGYDRDLFNGFEEMVEVTAGPWAGSVIIGNASVNDEVFYDLVWTLQRSA